MRNLVLAIAASIFVAGCSSNKNGGSPSPGGASTVSCLWGSTCDQYSGTIDPTFATNLQTTCQQHGVAFATTVCPTVNQVAGYCDYGTSNGIRDAFFYYSPTYDTASAQADCQGNVIGVAWVP